jgi:hypothetical protein
MLFWHRSKFERRKAGGSAAAQQGGGQRPRTPRPRVKRFLNLTIDTIRRQCYTDDNG